MTSNTQQQRGEIVPVEKKYANLNGLLQKSKGQIALALPKHMNPDRMLRIALTSVRMNPKLLECDQISFLAALMTSAQLGLEPDGVQGQAYLLPYWNGKRRTMEVQFRAGYRGLMELARRSREIGNWFVGAVRERDHFDYMYGSEAYLKHKPAQKDRGALVAAYAGAKLRDGGIIFRVLGEDEIKRAKEASSSRDREGNLIGPWVTDEEEMWIKTAIRRVCKLLPTSPELQAAITLDESAERGVPQDLDAFVDLSGGAITTADEDDAITVPADDVQVQGQEIEVTEQRVTQQPRQQAIQAQQQPTAVSGNGGAASAVHAGQPEQVHPSTARSRRANPFA